VTNLSGAQQQRATDRPKALADLAVRIALSADIGSSSELRCSFDTLEPYTPASSG